MSTENPDDFCVCGARRKAHLAPFSGCGDFEPFEGPTGDVCAVCHGDGYGGEGPVSPCDACGGSGRGRAEQDAQEDRERTERHHSKEQTEPASLAGILGTHGPADLAEATDILRLEGLEEHLGLARRIADALAKTRVATRAEGPIVSLPAAAEKPPAPRMSWALKTAREALRGAAWSNGPTLQAITAAILQAETTGYERAIAVLREHDAPIARACANLLEKNK